MTDDFPVEEVGTFEGLLYYTLLLAQRWELVTIPEQQQAVVTGAAFEDDRINREGFVRLLPRAGGDASIVLTDCSFEHCTVVGAVECILGLIRTEQGSRS